MAAELAPLGQIAQIQLGKMLQPAPATELDEEHPYLRAGLLTSLNSLGELPVMFTSPEDGRRYEVRQGDLVVAEGGDCGQTGFVPNVPDGTIIQNSLHRVRSGPAADLRFLRYCLQAIYDSGWLEVLCNKSTFGHLTREKLASVRVPNRPLDEQRAIADYLDRETARIDALIAAKERLLDLVKEQFDSQVSLILWSEGGRRVRLKFLTTQPTSGNRDHSSFTPTDEGIPCLRGLNVRPARIDRNNLFRISPEDHASHRGTRLRAGDIVIVRSGLAGSAAVIPDDLDDCNCVDLVIVRRSHQLVPRYLEYVINSREAREQVAQRSVGALLTHFNAMDVADLAIPARTLDSQREVVTKLDVAMSIRRQLDMVLERQLVLLREHRQALIATAVTGQTEVPVAA